MAMTYATITGKITTPGSTIGVRARVTATPMTTASALKFPTEDQITWGPETAETNAAGVLSALKVPTNHGISELFWKIEAERLDQARGVPKRWTLGTYQITASADLADLVQIDVTVVSGTVLVSVADMLADTQAARDAAAASQAAAAGSATTAQGSATAAATSETNAATSASSAATSATTAATKATEAASSATAAAGSATAAATSETNAATSASTASTKATEAAASATSAQGYAQQAAGSVSLVAWAPATAYTVGDVRQVPDGSTARRNADGTSGATFDATERSAWTAIMATAGTMDADALAAAAGAVTSVNTLTGDVVLTQDNIGDGVTNKAYTATEQAKLAGVQAGATANATDAQLRDRSTHTGTQTASTITGLAAVATSGSASDITTGTLPTAVLPPLAVNEVTVVANEAAMLALTAQRGDMAVRADNGRTYVLSSDSPATLADWKEILAAGQVQSVNAKTGVVSLTAADVGAATPADVSIASTADRDRANHTGTQALSTITGVGDAAAKNTGTAAGTLAAGDDTRITGAAQKAANLSDLASAATARGNLDAASSSGGGREKSAALSATAGPATGDLSAASIFTVTPTGNITLAFSNVPATGTACTVTVIVTQGATAYTVTPPTGTKWMGSAAPTQAVNKACAFTFLTTNGGTTWYASAAVEQ